MLWLQRLRIPNFKGSPLPMTLEMEGGGGGGGRCTKYFYVLRTGAHPPTPPELNRNQQRQVKYTRHAHGTVHRYISLLNEKTKNGKLNTCSTVCTVVYCSLFGSSHGTVSGTEPD
jgi:hypothetical protein